MQENRFVMEMLNRQRIEEMYRVADQDRLRRQADGRPAQTSWLRRLAGFGGGRVALDATGTREVPGL